MSFSFPGAVDISGGREGREGRGGGGWVKCKSTESPDFRSPVVGISVNSQYHQLMHIWVRLNKLLSFNT